MISITRYHYSGIFLGGSMKLFWFIVLFMIGCGGPGMYEYRSVSPERNIQGFEKIPIYVGLGFSQAQRMTIYNVINEWNYSLNGYARIEVVDWKFDRHSDSGKIIKKNIEISDEGIMILPVKVGDTLIKELNNEENTAAIAFVDDLGNAHHIVVIVDRMGRRNFHQILLHEFGHALGARHVRARSLMFSSLENSQTDCVDKITAAQIANYRSFNLDHMNYCLIPGFE